MLNTRSFSDILIDQILEDYDLKQASVASNTLNAGWESTLDPHGMAQILAQTETHSFARTNRHNPYKFKAQTSTQSTQSKASAHNFKTAGQQQHSTKQNSAISATVNPTVLMKASPARPPHNMSNEQLVAYSQLKQFVPQLPDNFDLTQLKTAYRRSVLQAHPDHGGTSETFQNVKKSYQILTALVK